MWHEFCDWYLELTKPVLYREDGGEKAATVDCLYFVLEKSIQALHPFMPFVTEEIWDGVFGKKESIMLSEYPAELPRFADAEGEMEYIIDAVTGIRSIRGELNISPSLEMKAGIKALSPVGADVLAHNLTAIKKLTRCSEINVSAGLKRQRGSAVSVRNGMEIFVPIEGLLDINNEISRLRKELSKIDESLSFLNKKLLNEDFLKNAPKSVLEKDKAKFNDLLAKKGKIEENIGLLESIDKNGG